MVGRKQVRKRILYTGGVLVLCGIFIASALSAVVLEPTHTVQARTAAAGPLQVVAAENFWGSIAAQEGGSRVHVTSIISNRNTDPHSYEATPADARTIAHAKYVIVNGAGYDAWGNKLLSANPVKGRQVLNIGDLLGKKEGDNAHFWYGPNYVTRVANAITNGYKQLDPSHKQYFDQQHARFMNTGLHQYHQLINTIRQKYHGVPVGATESIFIYLSDALHLNLTTPPEFMKAVAEGTEPSARDKATFDQEVTGKKIKVFIYNRQNSTPDVEALRKKAAAAHIPIVSITETLEPASASFQAWQSGEMQALKQALAKGTGH